MTHCKISNANVSLPLIYFQGFILTPPLSKLKCNSFVLFPTMRNMASLTSSLPTYKIVVSIVAPESHQVSNIHHCTLSEGLICASMGIKIQSGVWTLYGQLLFVFGPMISLPFTWIVKVSVTVNTLFYKVIRTSVFMPTSSEQTCYTCTNSLIHLPFYSWEALSFP